MKRVRLFRDLQRPVIAVDGVDAGQGVVPQKAILDGEDRAGGLGIFQEHGVMPHTEPHHDIEFCLFMIEDHGLTNRVAHGFKEADPYILIEPDAEDLF